MKIVPLKELKENLADWMQKVFKGEHLQIHKHNKPYAVIYPPYTHEGLLLGEAHAQGSLSAAIKGGTKKKALNYLIEDRERS